VGLNGTYRLTVMAVDSERSSLSDHTSVIVHVIVSLFTTLHITLSHWKQ